MAIKIGSTIVFNDSSQMSWNILNSKPDIISTLVKTKTGDLTVDGSAYDVNYSSANGRIEILYDTNCACVCACDCGVGCFLGKEQVLLPNGTYKRLDQIRIGEKIACFFNDQTEVLGIRQTHVKHNKLYRINKNLITTGEHGFWSADNNRWLVCDKENDHRITNPWRKIICDNDGREELWHFPQGLNARQMLIGDKLVINNESIRVDMIEKVDWIPQNTILYTLVTTSSFILNEGWVVTGWSGKDFDKPIIDDQSRRIKMLRGEILQWTPYQNNIGLKNVYSI